jgi:anthranilate synthase component 1
LASVAPTVRSFSGAFEPLDLIERFPERYPGLLESGGDAPGAGARFDILPIANGERLVASGEGVEGPHAASGSFLGALQSWWQALEWPRATERAALPFLGGWLVYLGYELAAQIEPTLKLPRSPDAFGALALRTPAAWLRNLSSGAQYLVAEPGAESLLAQFSLDLEKLPPAAGVSAAPIEMREEDPEHFLAAVRGALAYTAAGDVYQTNLSRLWQGQAPVGAGDVYRRLRRANPSPFAAFLTFGDTAIMSSSPERLAEVRAGNISTRPIAGTRPRGSNRLEDEALVRSLLGNEKERAEHVMLIDLERNDLGRICEGGSVLVDEFMTVETYAHVHHIVSNVSGRLNADVSPVDVIRALFPGGTITGCPKVRCMQIIGELEGVGRGAYTGSLGYINRNGDCDFNILIRTITARGGQYKFRAGAGIVADSDPVLELAETRAKAEGMLRALGGA